MKPTDAQVAAHYAARRVSARRQRVRAVARAIAPDAGCSDGGCVFGHPGGMATNGGCMCLKERDPDELRRTVRRLAAIARRLAENADG